jgi:hypothetical protein
MSIQPDNKPLDGSRLSAHLLQLRKSDLKLARRADSFKTIPLSHYQSLMVLGRKRYVAIVVSTYMSLLWDGWKSKRKTKRIPTNKLMVTRRMLHEHFSIGESTAGQILKALVDHKIILVAQKSVYSGKKGQNLGTLYRLPWMESGSGKNIHIYWGLLVSEVFIGLSVTQQAVIILLHQFHSRIKNRLTIKPYALSEYGIHRNRLCEYVNQLRQIGLLNYIEGDDYDFAWFDKDGKPNFNKLKMMHLSHTDPAPNSYQVAANQ